MSRHPLRTTILLAVLLAAGGAPPPPPAALSTAPPPPVLPSPAPLPAPAAARALPSPVPVPLRPLPPPAAGPGRRLYRAGSVPGAPATDEGRARAVLRRESRRLGLDTAPGSLVLVRAFTTPVGTHVRFRQVVDGVPVHGSEASVHWTPRGRLLVVNGELFPVPGKAPEPGVPASAARAAAADLADDGDGLPVETSEPRLAWLPAGKSARLAWEVVARSREETLRLFVDALEGGVLEAEDLRRSAEGSGRVFDPNPVWSRRDGSLRDGEDADDPVLLGEMVTVPLHRLDGSGRLRGKWVDLSPTRPRAREEGLVFHYTRSDPRFEQVNAYHHVDTLQEYVHAVLGFEGAAGEGLRVDAHHGDADNSFYDAHTGRLHFGDGGVDDAEDGDIVAHEYGHALQEALVPGFGRTREGGAMGEGFGDYLATTRRTSGSETWDAAVGSWDATAYSLLQPPALRRVDGSKVYPDDVRGLVHADGEIWSAALREIRTLMGPEAADRVIVGSHALLTPRATFADGAAAIVAADLSLRGGAGEAAIRGVFEARGIPVGDDPLEADDAPAAATPVDRALWEGLYAGDDDWFRIEVEAGEGAVASAAPGIPGQPPALALYDGSLGAVASSSRFDPLPSVSTGPVEAPTTFLLRVSPGRHGRSPYVLFVEGDLVPPAPDPFEPNGSAETAARLPTASPVRVHLSPGDEDWFLLEGTRGAGVLVTASFDGGAVDADLALFAPDGTPLAVSATTGSTEEISEVLGTAAPSTVLLRVTAAAGSGPVDLLAFVFPERAVAGRRALLGELAAGEETEFSLPVPLEPGTTARVRVRARPFRRHGALPEVEVLSPGGFPVVPFGTGFGKRGTTLDFPAPEGGDWRLRVRAGAGSSGGFRLKVKVGKPR